jgi:hypothetical protein
MEKRKFLKGVALAALTPTGAIAADNNRLFGTPSSVIPINPDTANKMRLTFARTSLPIAAWDQTLNFIVGLKNLATSAEAKSQFSKSPRAYFDAVGVVTSPGFEKSKEVAIARLVMDESAQAAASKGDYVSFLQRIKEFNLPTIPDSKGLIAKLAQLMREDAKFYERVKAAISAAGVSNPKIVSDVLASAHSGTNQSSQNENNIIVIDTAIVDTNTIVSTDIFAVTEVSIVIAAIAVVVIFVVGAKNQATSTYGQVSKLDSRIIEGASTAITAARLLGNKDFEVQVTKDLVFNEIEAIISAAEAVGITRINPQQREKILQICKTTAMQSLGLVV